MLYNKNKINRNLNMKNLLLLLLMILNISTTTIYDLKPITGNYKTILLNGIIPIASFLTIFVLFYKQMMKHKKESLTDNPNDIAEAIKNSLKDQENYIINHYNQAQDAYNQNDHIEKSETDKKEYEIIINACQEILKYKEYDDTKFNSKDCDLFRYESSNLAYSLINTFKSKFSKEKLNQGDIDKSTNTKIKQFLEVLISGKEETKLETESKNKFINIIRSITKISLFQNINIDKLIEETTKKNKDINTL